MAADSTSHSAPPAASAQVTTRQLANCAQQSQSNLAIRRPLDLSKLGQEQCEATRILRRGDEAMHRRRRNRRLVGKVAGIEADRRSANGAELSAGEQCGSRESGRKAGAQSVIIPTVVQLQPKVEQ
jgi:hypothetical protein